MCVLLVDLFMRTNVQQNNEDAAIEFFKDDPIIACNGNTAKPLHPSGKRVVFQGRILSIGDKAPDYITSFVLETLRKSL